MTVFPRLKDPDSIIDYTFDWANELASGEEILTSTWIIDPDPSPSELAVSSDTKTTTTTTAFFTGGVLGKVYRATNRIVTDSSPPRTMDRTLPLRIGSR